MASRQLQVKFFIMSYVRKNYKSCFANEDNYMAVTTEIFALIDEAYRTLIHPEKRMVYDAGLHHNNGRSSNGT